MAPSDGPARANRLICYYCGKESETGLLYYGDTANWWCSQKCEEAWIKEMAPIYLENLIDREGDEDER